MGTHKLRIFSGLFFSFILTEQFLVVVLEKFVLNDLLLFFLVGHIQRLYYIK